MEKNNTDLSSSSKAPVMQMIYEGILKPDYLESHWVSGFPAL